MLVETLFVLGDGGVIFFSDVVNQDYTVVGSAGDQVWVLYAELAGGDLGLVVEYLFGEGWVFKGPEHEKATFAGFFWFIGIDHEFVANGEEVLVDGVPVCAGD